MGSSEGRLPFTEKRKRPTPAISPFLFWGRRTSPSSVDGQNAYVDRPAREAWQGCLLLICLSLLDARLSLMLFADGKAQELNPILLIGLQYGEYVFLGIKLVLTLFSLFVLLIHWNFVIGRGHVRVVWLIRTLIVAYAMIVVYEILLIWS